MNRELLHGAAALFPSPDRHVHISAAVIQPHTHDCGSREAHSHICSQPNGKKTSSRGQELGVSRRTTSEDDRAAERQDRSSERDR